MAVLNIAVTVTDEEFGAFLRNLALKSTTVTATTDDGEVLDMDDNSETDMNGVPWLESVHAGTKRKTKDKRWMRLKGVTEEQRDATEKAWLAANVQPLSAAPLPVHIPGAAPVPVAAAPVPAPVAAPVPAPVPVAAAPVPAPVPAPAAPAPVVPAVVVDTPKSLDDVTAAFAKFEQRGITLDNEFVTSLYKHAGIADASSINTEETARAALIRTIEASLAAIQTA